MAENRSEWQVHLNIWLKHIAHDLQKGVYNQTYKWSNVTAITGTQGSRINFLQRGEQVATLNEYQLGTEKANFVDNQLKFRLTGEAQKSIMTQESNGNNAKTQEKGTTMKESTKNEIASLASTVGAQFKEAGAVALKTKTGEALLKAVENLVLEKAGFVGKVKFKFFPEALDIMVAAGVSIIVAEYAGENHAAQIAAEALRLAAMRRITDLLPITEIIDSVTKSGDILEKLG